MNNRSNLKLKGRSLVHQLTIVVVLLSLVLGGQAPAFTITAKAAPIPLTLNVVDATNTNTAITTFKYIINIDNTGTTEQKPDSTGKLPTACTPDDPNYPANCNWVSVAGVRSSSPIYTQGDQRDFNPDGTFKFTLPDGRYLISVLADGYKLDGEHFTAPLTEPVTVKMQPTPLPDATIRTWVFEDNASTNSAPDAPVEHGLGGFTGHIVDYIGEVTTDVYGNPLCTRYMGENPDTFEIPAASLDVDGAPIPNPAYSAGHCVSLSLGTAAQVAVNPYEYTTDPIQVGMLAIPHLGPNRYALSVIPPVNQGWIQTTTLEGNHDWDAWVMEGATGYDTEFVVAGEPFPATFFGFVKQGNNVTCPANQTCTGKIKGVAEAVKAYIPPAKGLIGEPGILGAKTYKPLDRFYVSLNDLTNGDQAIYIAKGNPDGTFEIDNVPDGDYTLGIWDEPQDYIFNEMNVTVRNHEVVDMGVISMLGWWTTIDGYVFNDLNANGKRDAGEPGIANFPVVMKTRANSVMDRGATLVTTDATGYYYMENAYPMTQWLVEEAYSDTLYTTGVTYQADNQPAPTTVLGAGVDVSLLPIIGLGGRLDWGVRAYDKGTNGGIVGTVSYDTTRNELDPRLAAVEDWQPGISNLVVDLYAPITCGTDVGVPCDATHTYELAPDGSYKLGRHLNSYLTETWQRPTNADSPSGCVARDVNGDPLIHGPNGDENVLDVGPDAACLEAPMMGVQFSPYSSDQGTPDANFGAAVDGNYGFGDGCFNGTLDATNPSNPVCTGSSFDPLPANADYIVKVNIPNDALGRPKYQVTREEDINVAFGDAWVPQVPPPVCAGRLHIVDVAGIGGDNHPGQVVNGISVPESTPVINDPFVGMGGSPYEGQAKPLCDMKLVHVADRRSIAPTFNLFTDVPVPARFWGLVVDDLNFSSDNRTLANGEKLGVAFVPVGIYDYTNRLITTVESDFNGLFDVLLPSTNRISCPTPSGVCANLYRFVGNDPGVPGHLNTNFNPLYRTISAEFEGFPGLIVPADLAPTQVGVAVQLPGQQTLQPVVCKVNDASTPAAQIIPEFYSINKPYMYAGTAQQFTIQGANFGAASGSVALGSSLMTINSWTNNQITFTVPGTLGAGYYQMKITAANSRSSINALTFSVLNTGNGSLFNPTLFEVGPRDNPNYSAGKEYNLLNSPAWFQTWFVPTVYTDGAPSHAIQNAINAAAAVTANSGRTMVVVYPNTPQNDRINPRGAYYENLIINSPVKLQGVGPGSPDGVVRGSIIDGSAFGGDTVLADDWRNLLGSLTWAGNQETYEGQIIYILPRTQSQFTSQFAGTVDGFDLLGGDQVAFPNNINQTGGGQNGLPPEVVTQGGAIFANAYAHYLQITNNIVEHNGGAYGTIRIGTPNLDLPNTAANEGNNFNDHVRIANNRIIANGGTNLAGAIGLFSGSDNYEVANNDLCGNFSAEYGGAISHFGLSPKGSIHDNRIYFNHSYDEGAGIMIGGELPFNPTANYGTTNGPKGAGAVDIFNNLIQGNLADDDGGGIRFLMAGNFAMNVYNNMIVNNVSTHEGGGIALDDASNVAFYNNTIMKSITTATAVTSTGIPAPAGLSTGFNSVQLRNSNNVNNSIAAFTPPLMFNNIFWDNRAGTRGWTTVAGIGLAGDLSPINHWDMGAADGAGLLSPTNTIYQSANGVVPGGSGNIFNIDPLVNLAYDLTLSFQSWRTNPNFTGAMMVSTNLPSTLLVGDYHIQNSSLAKNAGANCKLINSICIISAPLFDIDNESRPAFGFYDIGADEIPAFADLAITKTDGVTTINPGNAVRYTVVVTNNGPDYVNGARVNDSLPNSLTGATWSCSASAGSSCGTTGGSGNISNVSVNLLNGGAATFTINATLSISASGTLSNTASVTTPNGWTDLNAANNSATDVDTIIRLTDLYITKTDTLTTVTRGQQVRYIITVGNNGPLAVTGASVTDTFPSLLSGTINWSCTTTGGASCGGSASGSGNINRSVNIPVGGTVTFTTTSGSLSSLAPAGFLANTATVTPPNGTTDSNPANNSATDTDSIVSMHVASIAVTNKTGTPSNTYSTTVTVTVVDSNGNPVQGATVSGSWSNGSGSGSGGSGSGNCSTPTNAAGQCTITRTGISRNRSVIWTVSTSSNGITSTAYPYQPSANVVNSLTVSWP